ncbi:MAG: CofH family radical SAM protein [Phycisphaerales bacterium]|nr:CofH family radical SAM protein [Phycisphaerales bacterium]
MPTIPPSPVKADPALDAITAKTQAGQRLTLDEGRVLFETSDIWSVCDLADQVRRRLHGSRAYYNINQHVNYTNICALSCSFCEFSRKRGDHGAYEMSVDEIRARTAEARDAGATEIHIVGGLHPYLPFTYYTDMCRAIRDEAPRIHIKAFTAVEIVHFARISKRPRDLRGVLLDLQQAGLGSLPGGGAEVFDDRIQKQAFRGKLRADAWIDVHRIAHELGMNSNATMLYGHVESIEDRLTHFDILRRAQDEALTRRESSSGVSDRAQGCFQAFVPLPFLPDGSDLTHLAGPDGLENLRTLAVSRLMLDNIPHIKAFWIMQTLPMSQLMLRCGADDIDGTVVWYDITKCNAGATHQEMSVWDLRRAIVEAEFEPIERDTLYRRVMRDGAAWHVAV